MYTAGAYLFVFLPHRRVNARTHTPSRLRAFLFYFYFLILNLYRRFIPYLFVFVFTILLSISKLLQHHTHSYILIGLYTRGRPRLVCIIIFYFVVVFSHSVLRVTLDSFGLIKRASVK